MNIYGGNVHVLILTLFITVYAAPVWGKSISIYISHDETFAVRDTAEQQFIHRDSDIQITTPASETSAPTDATGQQTTIHRDNDIQTLTNETSRRKDPIAREEKHVTHRRKPRQSGWNVDHMVHDGWTKSWTTPAVPSKKLSEHNIAKITDEEIRKAELAKVKEILIYTSSILGSVVFFSLFTVLLFRNPESFICGCCLCQCCIEACCPSVNQYLSNPQKFLHDRMNDYIPGMIVHEDGHIEHYQPTQEELDKLGEIIEEIMG